MANIDPVGSELVSGRVIAKRTFAAVTTAAKADAGKRQHWLLVKSSAILKGYREALESGLFSGENENQFHLAKAFQELADWRLQKAAVRRAVGDVSEADGSQIAAIRNLESAAVLLGM